MNDDVRHEYRTLTDAEKRGMVRIKDAGLFFLREVDAIVPAGRESSLARTKIEEAVMWAVKGLTRDN